MSWLGIDTGGTFTDFVWYSADDPEPRVVKVPTDAADPRGVLAEGLRLLERQLPAAVRIVLGTTLATNTVLEGDGATVATVTSRGYRDVVEIGRQTRFEMYNLKTLRRAPLSPRRWRHEVDERLEWDGTPTATPSEGELDELAERLGEDGVDAIAVCFLFSYVDDQHETLVAKRLREPERWFVTASHEVARQSKEYDRFSTTLLNAYVGPKVNRFLGEFVRFIEQAGADPRRAHLMAGNGGSMTVEAARQSPVRIINSGPAAGVQAAVHLAGVEGATSIITCDMGGTSTDVCLIKELAPSVTSEGFLDRLPFVVPHLDLVTIGTGGGSVAWVDIGGELELGPRSAGAVPGPACYGRGGSEPTITDAHAVLGRLADGALLGGAVRVDRSLAEAAVARLLPSFEELSLTEMAAGIVRVAIARMATALREVSVARGFDPRDFTLIAYGGAGPMHAAELASELEIGQVIVPPIPGNFSALGLVMSDVRHDLVTSRTARVQTLELAEYGGILQDLDSRARDRLHAEGFPDDSIEVTFSADLRFAGQWFELNLHLPHDIGSMEEVDRLFRRVHVDRYGVDMDRPVEFVNFRATARGLVQKPAVAVSANGHRIAPASREVHIGGELCEVPVYQRLSVPIGAELDGPAIIEEFGATTVVAPGFRASATATGALVLSSHGAPPDESLGAKHAER